MEFLYIGVGGIFGAVTRYWLGKWVARRWEGEFPLATFCINITGSFILGFLFIIFYNLDSNMAYLKHLTTTGFLGAYTTYSTFTYEIINLIEEGETSIAVKYFLASVIVGLIAAFLGMALAGQLYPSELWL